MPHAESHGFSQSATTDWRGSAPSVSVVVPVFNSQQTLPALVARLRAVLQDLAPSFEIILVNDGSTDNTLAAIQELSTRYKQLRAVDLMRNYGQHNAILCGIRLAQFDVIIPLAMTTSRTRLKRYRVSSPS